MIGNEHYYTNRQGYYLIFIDESMPDGKKRIKLGPYSSSHAERLMKNHLIIPCHENMNNSQVQYVIEKINNFYKFS